jgi:O-antigen/teichoic acid export membrane protein
LWGRSLHYGVRVQIGSIFQFTNGRLDVIILQFFRPLPQVGYYVVAQTIAELLLNLAGAFQTSVLPLVSHYEGDARAEATSIESMRHYGILSAVATVGNAGLGPLIIYFGFGPDFHRGIPPMLILLPGVWFLGVATVIQGDLSGRARPGLSSMLAGLAAGITVILDLVLIPPLGVYGGALASDSAYFAYGVASMIALSRVTGIPIRRFMIPRREDLRLYGAALRRLLAARRAQPEGAAERPPPPTDG